MSMPLDLDAIRARVDAATGGPWHREHDEFGCVSIGNYGWCTNGPNAPEYDVDSEQGKADAEFIAHARADVPALLDEVEQLRAERDERRQVWVAVESIQAALHQRNATIDAVATLAESWRYDGRHGYDDGSHATGPGPDDVILDDASAALRRVLAGEA